MIILIDGHNLVPKIPGLSLNDPDDEIRLVELLQEFARRRRRKLEVFFDNAPVGWPRIRTFGTIVVRFSRPGHSADEEIRGRLVKLGKEARNCLVVSSDLRVQGYGRSVRANVISSEQFAGELQSSLADTVEDLKSKKEDQLNETEIEEWMKFFGENEQKKRSQTG
jgi:hypothetical protein